MTDAQYTSPMKKDEELDPELFHVAREKGTEIPYTGKYVETKDKGMYMCAICGTTLFLPIRNLIQAQGGPLLPNLPIWNILLFLKTRVQE